MFLLAVAVALIVGACECAQFPASEIHQCRVGDTECIKSSANSVLKTLFAGNQKIHFQKFDPLHITRISLKQGAQSPVNIELNFNEVDLIGLSQQTCYQVSGFGPNPNTKHGLKCRGPFLVLQGPYTINGRILVLPINGNGISNFTLENPELIVSFTGKTKQKNGKNVLYTDDMKMDINISGLKAHFSNLYNGDKVLGASTNQFLNDNWSDIYGELKGNIGESFSLITQSILNNFWAHHDYRELFIA